MLCRFQPGREMFLIPLGWVTRLLPMTLSFPGWRADGGSGGMAGLTGLEKQEKGPGAGGDWQEGRSGRTCRQALLALTPTTRLPWARKESCRCRMEAGQGSPSFCQGSHPQLPVTFKRG